MRHFDVQPMGGVVLHEGKIAEMATGEGKTLVATLPAYLNALTGRGVHIVTVNDYLARRDARWMGPIYHLLGLRRGIQGWTGGAARGRSRCRSCTTPWTQPLSAFCIAAGERRDAYARHHLWPTTSSADYLRDNMRFRLDELSSGSSTTRSWTK